MIKQRPPKYAERFLGWFIKPDLAEEVLGDLDEKFYLTIETRSLRKARRNYWYQVINYLRPFAFKFFKSKYRNNTAMLKHNFKVSYRQMLRNKGYSIVNIGGLAMGMVVAMLIGLWVHDELTFNKYHKNYETLVHVLRHEVEGDRRETNSSLITGLGTMMKEKFADQLDGVFMVRAREQNRVLAAGDRKFRQVGLFMQENGPELLSFEMIQGTYDAFENMGSILLSESFAKKLFGDEDPMGKFVTMDARDNFLVGGIYKDIPKNSKFADAAYVCRLAVVLGGPKYLNVWGNYNTDIYAKVNPNVDLENLADQINKAAAPNFNDYAQESGMKFYLHPMKDWHLKSEFQDHKQVTSQQMKLVWLYAIIGIFVLVLACINFMNLSTARSEKRAKEVGIRKTLGSVRRELIGQFYMESFLYTLLAFAVSLGFLSLLLPWFNETSAKEIAAPWGMPTFWLASIGFVLFTALVSGSYPAIFLSSFKPIKALKGTVTPGKGATIPRKILVVFQFTISIALIIGTITVNKQIESAKNRPVGYSPKGMLSVSPASPNFRKNYQAMRTEMLRTGMAVEIGGSNYPVINALGWNPGFTWEGMDPTFSESFNTISITPGYAEAVDMKFIYGRPFSMEPQADRNGIILNRSAMEAMRLDNPVGMVINFNPNWADPRDYVVIGVVEDMVKASPYEKTYQSVMFNNLFRPNYLYIKLNPNKSASEAIPVLEEVFNQFLPEAPFDYTFADDDYNKKFIAEERIASQASFFSILAIFISCLGLFALASFVAEQRTKEIGIRKVLGASILSLWKLLSKDFAVLVIIACLIAIPISSSVLNDWLDTFEVQTELSWWIFAAGGLGAFLITLITVSFQAIKAAMANPVKSLRSE